MLEELRMDLDSPWGALRQEVEFNSFVNHPYRFPVIGTYDDVRQVTLEQLGQHYRSYYTPTNSLLVVVGDFRAAEVLQRIQELFGSIPARPVLPAEHADEENRGGPLRLEVVRPSHVSRMLWSFPAPSIRNPDHYCLDIIDKALSEGKLGRLYTRLVEEERVASGVSTEFDETWDRFLFFIRAELQPDVAPERVEAIVAEELERLCAERLSDQEFERSRNQCLAQFVEDFETTLDQSVQIGLLETLDRFEYWNSYQERMEALTPEAVRQTAERYLVPNQLTLGTILEQAG